MAACYSEGWTLRFAQGYMLHWHVGMSLVAPRYTGESTCQDVRAATVSGVLGS